VTSGGRKLHNKLCDLYFSSVIIGVIKSRMKYAGYVTHMGEMRNAYSEFWWGNLKGEV
jgi:hypothetical protein